MHGAPLLGEPPADGTRVATDSAVAIDNDVDEPRAKPDEARRVRHKRTPLLPRNLRNGTGLGSILHAHAATYKLRKKKRATVRDNRLKAEADKPLKQHSFLYSMLNSNSHKPQARWYKTFSTLLIIISVVTFIFSTVNGYQAPARAFFYSVEATASIIFLLEFLLRVAVVTQRKRKKFQHPLWGRVHYILSFEALCDLLAAVPFFLELAIGTGLPTFTWVRVLRLFRILKTEKYTKAFASVYRVVWFQRGILTVALLICLMLVLITSTLLYYIAQTADSLKNSEEFQSIPSALYVSVMMLTGQGGPDGPLPWYMKLLCALTAIFSVPVFVIPSSMLTWGFEAEAERMMAEDQRRRKRRTAMMRKGELMITSSSSDDDGNISSDIWDEYEKVVLGEEVKEEDNNATKEEGLRNLMRDLFKKYPELASKNGDVSYEDLMRMAQAGHDDDDGPSSSLSRHRGRGRMTSDSGRGNELRKCGTVDRRIRMVQQLFRTADTDGSGVITSSELHKMGLVEEGAGAAMGHKNERPKAATANGRICGRNETACSSEAEGRRTVDQQLQNMDLRMERIEAQLARIVSSLEGRAVGTD